MTLCIDAKISAQTVIDSTKASKAKLTPLPVAFYLPETGFGFGGLGILTFRLKNESFASRQSSVQLGFSYTTKKQILVFLPYEIYKDNNSWRGVGELGFYKYFYNFYGLGIDSEEEDLETYDVTYPRFRGTLYYELMTNFSLGVSYQFDRYSGVRVDDGGLLNATLIEGKMGGILSNVGFNILYDNRDKLFFPTSGYFIDAGIFTSVNWLGSSFDYSNFYLDFRKYQLIKGQHILALNLYMGLKSSGTPLFDLSYIGSNRTRGFNDRRFLGLSELSLTAEYRFPIYKRFGGVLFGASGTVAGDFDSLWSNKYVHSFGAGIRFVINQKDGIRVRLDYGFSPEGGNLYLTVREAF